MNSDVGEGRTKVVQRSGKVQAAMTRWAQSVVLQQRSILRPVIELSPSSASRPDVKKLSEVRTCCKDKGDLTVSVRELPSLESRYARLGAGEKNVVA